MVYHTKILVQNLDFYEVLALWDFQNIYFYEVFALRDLQHISFYEVLALWQRKT